MFTLQQVGSEHEYKVLSKQRMAIRRTAPNFGVARHLIDGVMDVYGILDHCAILVHFNFLGDAGNGKVITVAVKLNAAERNRRGGREGFNLAPKSQHKAPKSQLTAFTRPSHHKHESQHKTLDHALYYS